MIPNDTSTLCDPLSVEAPIVALLQKPIHAMTEDELRNHVIHLRQLQSNQGFRAALTVESTTQPKTNKLEPKVDLGSLYGL